MDQTHSHIFKAIVGGIILCLGAQACALDFAGGTGEPNDPYQIATAEQLIAIGSDPNLLQASFILVADIDLSLLCPGSFPTALIAPSPEYSYPGDSGTFRGHFDGNAHVIRNLRINDPSAYHLGLFGFVGPGGRVENLHIEDADVTGYHYVGLLAGNNGGTISNCSVAGFVQGVSNTSGLVGTNGVERNGRSAVGSLSGRIEDCESRCAIEGRSNVGGLIGVNLRGPVTSSWADCTIDGASTAGGLIGQAYRDEITSCYALGRITGDHNVAGLIGSNSGSVVSGCYAQVDVTGNHTVAGLIAENRDGTIYCCYSAGEVSGKYEVAGLISSSVSGVVVSCYWDQETAGITSSASGEGKTTRQMQSAATFDGWGFLEQWTIDESNDYPRLAWQGMPGEPIRDGEHSYSGGTGEPGTPFRIQTAEDLMTLCRYARDWDKHFILTRDIDLTESDTNSLTPIGLVDIPFTGVFNGDDHVIRGLRYNLPDAGYVSLFRYVGQMDVDANTPNGIIRHLHLDQVDLIGGDWVAGLVGLNRGLLESCSTTGSLVGARDVAGLVAQNLGLITDCWADVHVLRYDPQLKGKGDAGGLVVRNSGTIRGSYACGRVDGTSGASATGGLVAMGQGGEIENSWASAEVNGFWAAGGLVGRASGTKITGCYACGSVKSSGSDIGQEWAGGLVGSMYGALCSCYATGPVSGNGYVGALVGLSGGTIASCYATGEVTGPGPLGGLIADEFFSAVYLSYWDSQTTGIDTSPQGAPKSTQQLMQSETFRGWGYGGHWKISEGQDYPRLSWEEVPGELIVDEPCRYAGGSGTADDPYQIGSTEDFAAIAWHREDFDKSFLLTADINMTSVDPDIVMPIGTDGIPFTGTFDGGNHVISNFTCIASNNNYLGLFGAIGGSKAGSQDVGRVSRLLLLNARISGQDNVAALAGANRGLITDCSVVASVEGHWNVGGLVGDNYKGTISRCSSSSDVSGDLGVAGITGHNGRGYIDCCGCAGSITGNRDVGGLAGTNSQGTLSNCYCTCDVFSTSSAGGLVDDNRWEGTIERCYFAGQLVAAQSVAGLVLVNTTEYASPGQGTLVSCFWDVELSGTTDGILDQDPDPEQAVGLTTAQMQTASPFIDAGWDFETVWMICEGRDYPHLRWEYASECEASIASALWAGRGEKNHASN